METTTGKIRGATIDAITSFKGIPYGGPTDGLNRFRPPVRPESWAGVRDALAYGNSSPQPASGLSLFRTASRPEPESEDCLYLNVWTPGVGNIHKRPVLFWCHGGGFTMGSGSAAFYDGRNLAHRGDVVVITVNHRLGPLGYCYLSELMGEEYAASGNVGMLDLVAALEWVRDNIEAFGGDPGNVTIFGESGGGAKVSALMAMPCAAGLFHRAIVQSGPGIRLTLPERARANAEKLLKELDIPAGEPDRLSRLTTEQIFAANARAHPDGRLGWAPVFDGSVLPQHPFEPTAPAISANIPLLIGTNKDEATAFFLADPEINALDEEKLYARIRPYAKERTDALIATYRHAYPEASWSGLFLSIMGDQMMRINSITVAERKHAQGAAPVFMYLFTWETPVLGGRLKSCHALEIPFVFDNLAVSGELTGKGSERVDIAENMSEAWLAFARNGVPDYRGLPTWPAYTPEERATMIFDTTCRVEHDPGRQQREAWSGMLVHGIRLA
ncbi:MAG TPA: carboxylesterase/lipase family protein [Ktedonobacteraceae bacterium]|nr:carboxylesterase/lipase family protein [Ktedonobacteraceae bacterium]